ncbi:AsmA family protein [Desulfomicrobium escambiense]|uniref:AsmA family protein n=1 Tax=Desulfomicrobium escambiense TaxID=29503 RepID=UPI0003F9C781|nr:AsmA family protein [Desulfomicrobium escambiense]
MASKWILRAVLVAVLGLAALAGVLFFGIDPNDFKPQIVSAVRDNTGRELIIDGDLKLGFFPYLAVSIDGVQLRNGQGFEGPFLTLKNARLKARLFPLLLSRLEVVALDVDGLSVFLTRDADGRGNWMDLATPEEPSGAAGGGSMLKRDKRVPALASLIVDGLSVTEARVVWDDRLKDNHFDVSGIHLDVSDFAFGEPFDVDTRAAAIIGDMSGELAFSAKAVLELDRLMAEKLNLTARLSGEGLPQSPETIALSADYFSTDGRLDNGRLQGLGLDVRFATRQMPGAGSAGNMEVAPFSPKDACARLHLPLPAFRDPTALERMEFSCDWAAVDEGVEVSDLRLVLDNSTMQGGISVQGRKNPFVSLDLRVDSLNLDRYRIRSAESAGRPSSETGEPSTLPMRELRALNGNATLAVGDLTAANVRCTDAILRAHAAGGRLVLDEVAASAYGGRLKASGALDVRTDTPAYSWSHVLSGLQIGPLLGALHGQEFVTGTAGGSASVETKGHAVPVLLRNLGGTYDFRVVNGALNGVNIGAKVRDGIRALKGQSAGLAEPERTVFSVLSGSGNIVQGVETSRDLLLLAPRFRITGGGQTDLVPMVMDYRLTLHLDGSEGAFDEGALGLRSFPVRVSGPVHEPTIAPDTNAVLRSLGLSGSRAVGDAIKGVGSGLNKGLEGLKQLFK